MQLTTNKHTHTHTHTYARIQMVNQEQTEAHSQDLPRMGIGSDGDDNYQRVRLWPNKFIWK